MSIMCNFKKEIQQQVSFVLKGISPEPIRFIVESSSIDGVDASIPCFIISKTLKKSPQDISNYLASKIIPSGLISHVYSSGGYLNFEINNGLLAKEVLSEIISKKAKYGYITETGIKINIEHTSTNPTGPIHVGRARNPIIGDTLSRCLKRCGHIVTTEYYVNDVGKQVITLTWGVKNIPNEYIEKQTTGNKELSFNNNKYHEKVDHKLVVNYRIANKMLETDPSVRSCISNMLVKFESGDNETISDVKHTTEIMLLGIRQTLSNINITLDRYTWESRYIADSSTKKMVELLKRSEYAKKTDDGAWYLDLKDFGIQGKNTNFVFTRSDGTTLYVTRDLAYHLDKFIRADRVIDVLGEDQKLGSRQLCQALEILGITKTPEPLFYSFVSLPEGKMSTRNGVVVYLDDLIDEAISRAYNEIKIRRNDMSDEKMRDISRSIGIGAIRYNIIRVQPEKQFVFKWDEALDFDGNSGPYIQYAYARMCSILKKAGYYDHDIDPKRFKDDLEINLVKILDRYQEIINAAGNEKHVHVLPIYGHELAVAFNQFYAALPILKAGVYKNARLTIVECSKIVLGDVIDCLGMDALEEM